MATDMLYGEESFASAPDNTAGLITPANMRSIICSQRRGGVLVQDNTNFTVPIVADTPVSINPLLPAATVLGELWSADGNNRAFPNYAVKMPDVTIRPGFTKALEMQVTINAQKAGQGEDNYLFQVDIDGTPVGEGVAITLTTSVEILTLFVNSAVDITDPVTLIGVTVTGIGTGDDIDIGAFEMLVTDDQFWDVQPL